MYPEEVAKAKTRLPGPETKNKISFSTQVTPETAEIHFEQGVGGQAGGVLGHTASLPQGEGAKGNGLCSPQAKGAPF